MPDSTLAPAAARQRVRSILETGKVRFSEHSREEMAKDGLTEVDCINVLRAGVVDPPDLINGSWRYRVRSNVIVVVIAFRSDTVLSVVTAWRTRK